MIVRVVKVRRVVVLVLDHVVVVRVRVLPGDRGIVRVGVMPVVVAVRVGVIDRVVVVACSEEIQMRRLMQRTGLGRNAAEAIIAAQMPLSEKIKLADHVIWNNGPESLLAEQAGFLTDLWIANL